MKKLLIIPFCVALLNAQSFDLFLENALKSSPYLKANSLNIEQANENAALTTRYKNPTLSLEASNFRPDIGKSDGGYRAALSQPIRLWGLSDARENLADAQKREAKSLVTLNRANFVGKLSLLYATYKSSVQIQKLAQEELLISKKIAGISKERYEAGTIAKVKFMQADLDVKRAQNSFSQSKAQKISDYYVLLGFGGMSEEVELESSYRFSLGNISSTENSVQIAYKKNQALSSLASAELNSNALEWINLYGEFEQEPDQSIARVGVDIPLVLFNTKSQERRIAELEAKKSELVTTNTRNAIQMKLKELQKSLEVLENLTQSTQELLGEQKELLKMYEDGYKVANINLIELQTIKNQMIQTKAKAINIQLLKERKIIEHNLLTGEYND